MACIPSTICRHPGMQPGRMGTIYRPVTVPRLGTVLRPIMDHRRTLIGRLSTALPPPMAFHHPGMDNHRRTLITRRPSMAPVQIMAHHHRPVMGVHRHTPISRRPCTVRSATATRFHAFMSRRRLRFRARSQAQTPGVRSSFTASVRSVQCFKRRLSSVGLTRDPSR